MAKAVAARRLRKSMLKEIDSNYNYTPNYYIDHNDGYSLGSLASFKKHEEVEDISLGNINEKSSDKCKKKSKLGLNFKTKLFLKIFASVFIIFLCLLGKLTVPDKLSENRYISKVVYEYSKDYSKEYLTEKLESFMKKIYPSIGSVIPESISSKVKEKYYYIKPRILGFSLKDELYSLVYPNQTIETLSKTVEIESKDEEIKEILDSIDTGETIDSMTDSSAVSIMQDDVATILSKNINIAVPVTGTITSEYGARDEVLPGVAYHTGIDIANSLGTEIKSATDGTVTKTQSMDTYYGNNIEIEKDGVTFKYAHLSEIKVNEGDEVKQGDIIGLMGSTGMSTGSHLHFEIIIDSRTVDPRKLVNF